MVKIPAERDILLEQFRDHDEVVFIALALAAKSDALVSGDMHLTTLRASAPVTILSVSELQSRLGL